MWLEMTQGASCSLWVWLAWLFSVQPHTKDLRYDLSWSREYSSSSLLKLTKKTHIYVLQSSIKSFRRRNKFFFSLFIHSPLNDIYTHTHSVLCAFVAFCFKISLALSYKKASVSVLAFPQTELSAVITPPPTLVSLDLSV